MTRAADIPIARTLADLVAIQSVNPMGVAHAGPEPVERGVVRYLEAFFADTDVTLTRQRVSDAHENLLIAVPGAHDAPGLLFESHMDTVPAAEWGDAAFQPIVDGRRVVGRGACDDKGPLLAMAIALRRVLDRGERPPAPIWLLAAADEEYAQTGIQHFARGFEGRLRGAVFGEPTQLSPIVQHKGIVRWDLTVHGRSAHSARPELGVNAILGMRRVLDAIAHVERELQQRFIAPLVGGPTLTVTRIQGGRTRNAVPDACTIALDVRIVPGMEPAGTRETIIAMLAAALADVELSHGETQVAMRPLDTAVEAPFSREVLRACQAVTGADAAFAGVPYGTDAAWFPAHVPALVLGPGDIADAHTAREEIDVADVEKAAEIYYRLMLSA